MIPQRFCSDGMSNYCEMSDRGGEIHTVTFDSPLCDGLPLSDKCRTTGCDAGVFRLCDDDKKEGSSVMFWSNENCSGIPETAFPVVVSSIPRQATLHGGRKVAVGLGKRSDSPPYTVTVDDRTFVSPPDVCTASVPLAGYSMLFTKPTPTSVITENACTAASWPAVNCGDSSSTSAPPPPGDSNKTLLRVGGAIMALIVTLFVLKYLWKSSGGKQPDRGQQPQEVVYY